jgi:hypothetical protein
MQGEIEYKVYTIVGQPVQNHLMQGEIEYKVYTIPIWSTSAESYHAG